VNYSRVVFAGFGSRRCLRTGYGFAVGNDFASRLNDLFDNVPGPDGKPYTNDAVIKVIAASGGPTISKGYLSELRTGKKDNPTLKHIEALADFFGVDPAYFVGDPEYADRLAAELKLLAGMKRAGVRDIALRASELSDQNLSMVEAILETVIKSREDEADGR